MAATSAPMGWHAARRVAFSCVRPLAPQRRSLQQTLDTDLVQPLLAPVDLPPYDRSAMDGYAVCGKGPWTICGHVALTDNARSLDDGQACTVVTGSALAARTTAVLRWEDATRTTGAVNGIVEPGANIRRRGEECRAGDQVLRVGTRLNAVTLGLLAALGIDELTVRPVPQANALVTGDEFFGPGAAGADKHRDAIGPMLPGLLAMAGGQLVGGPRVVADEPDLLRMAIESSHGDIVLVTGASSAGRSDFLRRTLADLRADVVVDGVDCRPGHPQMLALLDDTPIIGLPGNPFAALVAFWTLAAPCLAGLRGDPPPTLEQMPVEGASTGRASATIVPVRITDGTATPVGHCGSGMLRGAATADGLAVVTDRGAPAEIIRLR